MDSLRRCIALLGATETRRLLLLLHLIGSGNVRSNTLVRAAVMRARMMETIAAEVWPDTNRDEAAFLTGLFSQIEAIMAVPFAELAPHLALSADIEAAISGNTTSGFPADLLALVKAYERGEWARAEQLARELPLSLDLIADIYLESSAWSRVDF